MKIQTFTGTSALPFIPDLARLRIKVFQDFPYLYAGTMEYEKEYLQTLINAPDSIFVIAFDEEKVVGVSTGLPMEYETDNIQLPWKEKGYEVSKIFYYGESVLLKEYRGQGIGVRFFEHREKWAKKLGRFDRLAFCAVVRPEDHAAKPEDYVPLDPFWINRGFIKTKDLVCYIPWRDLEEKEESPKPLHFWYKRII